MKKQITIYTLAIGFLFALIIVGCNNQPTSTPETVVTEEDPMASGQGYTDPAPVVRKDTTGVQNNGYVFIEATGGALDGASYSVKEGGRAVTEGTTANGGYFTANLESGKTYSVTASANGYRTQTINATYRTGEVIKIGLKK